MMGTDIKGSQELTPGFVRDQLDEILAQEITALLDVDSDSAMMSFNLASISCITLIVEREREIKQYSDFPPERYTRESFINELMDIGLEKDEMLENTIHYVLSNGYISTDSKGDLHARMPAFMMAGFLDNMFPGMPGMNLVAFVLQMNEEVNSKRKTLELAKQSFKSTLKSRGVSVSKDKAKEKASQMVSGRAPALKKSKEISLKLKRNNLNRLSKLIKTRKQRSAAGDASSQLKIKDVFDKGPSEQEIKAREAQMQKLREQEEKADILARELARKDEKIRQAQEAQKQAALRLKEIELREKQLLEAQKQAAEAEQKASELEAKAVEMAQKEAQLKALEEKLKQAEEEKLQEEEKIRQEQEKKQETKKKSMDDEDIESRIAAFESELTMPCPLCRQGDVISQTTKKGKEFFSCSEPDCRFVSWDKPYHFECPLCKNSFLVETKAANGEKGLKCPRASCSYTQDNLIDPKQNMAAQAAKSGPAPRKKKRVVRRRKRR